MLFRLATTMVGTNEDERFTEETAGFANEEVPSWSFGTIATCIETDLCVLPGRFQRFAVTIGALRSFWRYARLLASSDLLISCTGLPIVLGLVGALRQ